MRIPSWPTIRWSREASEFLDALVDSDARFIDLQRAIEKVFEGGAWKIVSTPLIFEGQVIYLHRTPRYVNLPSLYVTFTVSEEEQMIDILEIRFAREALQ